MRFCFVGHQFHQKTRSSVFLVELLKTLGEVEEFYSFPNSGDLNDDRLMRELATSTFDCYVFFQTEHIAEKLLPLGLGRFVLAPMYDGIWHRSAEFWRQFADCDFISFSRVHHEELQQAGVRSAYFQYFPEPPPRYEREFDGSLSAFFWERLPGHEPTLQTVIKLCKSIGISALHLHAAPDLSESAAGRLNRPETFEMDGVKVTGSRWFDDRSDFNAVVERAHFVFAPRLREGIGMSFLEAMARGQIVVAPDMPTMNEYLRDRTSGILYDVEAPRVDRKPTAAELTRMSHAASFKMNKGYAQWQRDQERLASLLINDGRRWSTKDASSHFRNEIRRRASARARGQ
jgi:Glycosyl transferases group 1